jgi:uncharacterized membrane protein
MSHVDPILLLFLPIFALITHPLTLVFSQLVIVIFSSFLIYAISNLNINNKNISLLIALSFLSYPALGYLTSRTGFHGVSAAIPFFLGAFFVFEHMYYTNNFTRGKLALFWLLLIVTMTGKEQLPLYVFMYGLFIWFCRTPFLNEFKLNKEYLSGFFTSLIMRNVLTMLVVSTLWFILAFFVIIPNFAHYRIEGFNKFAQQLDINTETVREVDLDNYFLSRYEAFGSSYLEIIINILLDPKAVAKVLFGGDKVENLRMTFEPLLYTPLIAPGTLMMAIPDLLINYLTTATGVGTSEITNHRISMIIPILFLSVIFSVKTINNFISNIARKKGNKLLFLKYIIPVFLLLASIKYSYQYNNPVTMWMSEAVKKRLPSFIAIAKSDPSLTESANLKIGDVVRLSDLENKDRECAQRIVDMVPDNASVSGPDYLGAHLSLRETYAIFPAMYLEADYVIVDVFSRKILTILDTDLGIVRDVTEELIRAEDYRLELGCGNLFVFKNVGPHNKDRLLPLQERYEYPEKTDFEILFTLTVVDHEIPQKLLRGNEYNFKLVFAKRDDASLNDHVIFTTFVNQSTGEMYQTANLPTFAIKQPGEWEEDRYYIENNSLILPHFLEPGEYKVFVGTSNKVKTRSVYLDNIEVL